jgi:hypothetical protein
MREGRRERGVGRWLGFGAACGGLGDWNRRRDDGWEWGGMQLQHSG